MFFHKIDFFPIPPEIAETLLSFPEHGWETHHAISRPVVLGVQFVWDHPFERLRLLSIHTFRYEAI